ncbi:MAG TPA: Gfo/Idh/MocA family oxidoreductase [Fimbriimonadales bacterium]|nr:Gfo/Idh/MocA family oxidoreductase [Fimbriimonadales bacterium]
MKTSIGFLSIAHLHAYSYIHVLKQTEDAEVAGIWDHDFERGEKLADQYQVPFYRDREELVKKSDGVVVTSENIYHLELVEVAARYGKPVLCEKPIAVNEEHGKKILSLAHETGIPLMTAFPCRYSPAYQQMKRYVLQGKLGRVLAVCATNRGMCPGGWFTKPELSGGGAMMDHVVHVADLLRDLLESEPISVFAQIGNNLYRQEWEDTAILHVRFANDVFATLDSSWSRPQNYKIWGDVMMNVVGEEGVIEVDLFNQGFEMYRTDPNRYSLVSFGSSLDRNLIGDFLKVVRREKDPPITGFDGLQAARVAFAAYESVRRGAPVEIVE